MKIIELLTEGLIKVPETTMKELMIVVVGVYFGQLKSMYTKFNRTPPLDYKRAMKAATDKYGQFEVYDVEPDGVMRTRVKFRTKELPKSYRKKLYKDFSILTFIGAVPTSNQGSYYPKGKGRSGRILINIPGSVKLLQAINHPEVIGAQLIRLAGTVQHELMHAVQDISLRTVDQNANKLDYYVDGTLELDAQKYFTSAIEFSPNIKSAANNFIHDIELFKSRYPDTSRNDILAYFNHFINPTVESPVGEDRTNQFFAQLYYSDRPKWQKAIKNIHGLLRDYLN